MPGWIFPVNISLPPLNLRERWKAIGRLRLSSPLIFSEFSQQIAVFTGLIGFAGLIGSGRAKTTVDSAGGGNAAAQRMYAWRRKEDVVAAEVEVFPM